MSIFESILNDVIAAGVGIFILALFYSIIASIFHLPPIRELIGMIKE